MPSLLTPVEGLQEQTSAEILIWTIDTTGFTTSPASPSVVKVVKVSDGTDVKSTVMPSVSPTVSSAIITLPALKLLVAGQRYRIHITFTDGGSNTFEAQIEVICPI